MVWMPCKSKEFKYLEYSVLESIEMIDSFKWNQFVNGQNLFLSYEYLYALETSRISGLGFRYVQFFNKKNDLVGIAYLQIVTFQHNDDATPKGLISKLESHIKGHILEVLDFKGMICGNIFANGENGFLFADDISENDQYENLSNVCFNVRESAKISNQPSLVIMKDFWPESDNQLTYLVDKLQFSPFEIDVNMILDIHSEWSNMDDYLSSMVTKFRTKAKGCFKKSKDINIKSFSVEDIENQKSRIEELYLNVVNNSEFKISKLNADTFLNYKKELGENFILTGYYYDDKLVGFSTAFINNSVIEAGYIGLDYEYNFEYAVYQKMLYDYVDLAIQTGAESLQLGRTAEEIKSCLGARPVTMKLFAKHRNSISNKLLKPIINSVTPNEFEIRKPFKKEFIEKIKSSSS